MKKQFRIRRNEEFSAIMQAKRYVSHPNYVLYAHAAQRPFSRVGISVSKKLGGAVERNRIKRQVRSMMHEITDHHERFDCVIIVRNGYLKTPYAENLEALKEVFEKIKQKV